MAARFSGVYLRFSQLADFPYYDKIHLYVHDSMVKHKNFELAAEFARIHSLDLTQDLEMDVPEGYLNRWLKSIDLDSRIQADNIRWLKGIDVRPRIQANAEATPSKMHTDGSNHSMPQQQDSNRAANPNVLMPFGKPVPLPQFADFPYFDKIHLYIHDALVKCKFFELAANFARNYNADLQQNLEIDVPEGYFCHWYHSNKESNKRRFQQMKAPAERIIHTSFNVKQVGCLASSSCGKFLANAGHELMVLNFGAPQSKVTRREKEHSDIITDVRFKPNSTQFATSSFDKTIILWDATKLRKSVLKLEGHGEKVMSLDFNEKDTNLLCSCDTNSEIRFWHLSNENPHCVCTFQGGNKQVRFRPKIGNLLAAASGSTLNLIDVETYQILNKLEGHTKDIRCISWDESGNYISSVSEDNARLWCVSGKCMQELNSNGYIFESCIFHPRNRNLVIIASHRRLILWNTEENKMSRIISAHKGIVSSLTHDPNGNIISSGQDGVVKRWKLQL